MDLPELARLTSEFSEVVDELTNAARRAGQDVPGLPIHVGEVEGSLRSQLERVLTRSLTRFPGHLI